MPEVNVAGLAAIRALSGDDTSVVTKNNPLAGGICEEHVVPEGRPMNTMLSPGAAPEYVTVTEPSPLSTIEAVAAALAGDTPKMVSAEIARSPATAFRTGRENRDTGTPLSLRGNPCPSDRK